LFSLARAKRKKKALKNKEQKAPIIPRQFAPVSISAERCGQNLSLLVEQGRSEPVPHPVEMERFVGECLMHA